MDWLDFGISAVLTALRGAVKNPDKKAKLRPVMLKLAATIGALWGDDEEFGIVLDAKTKSEKVKLGL